MTDEQRVFARGVRGRGSEVIKMLEDLGGKVPPLDLGGNPRYIYFISHDGDITCALYDSEAGKIIMDFYHELHLPELWKDGDILVDNDDSNRFVVKRNIWNDGNFKAYLYVALKYIQESPIATFRDKTYHKADSKEVRRFHKILHKHGKDWDTENKRLVNWKWKPKDGEDYYYIISNGIVHLSTWFDYKVDNSRFSIGNCFKTKEEAEIMAEKFIKLLKGKS